MFKQNHSKNTLAIALLALVAFQFTNGKVNEATAGTRSSLEDAPAVRHRLLLVKKRVEFTPAFESTLNPEYIRTLSLGAKLELHLSDMWSIGVIGFYGFSRDTGLLDRVIQGLPTEPEPPTVPSVQQFEEHLNTIPFHGAAYIGFTPWYGKLAAFGKFFVNFDFYFQAGVSYANLENNCDGSCETFTDSDPLNEDITLREPQLNPNNDFPLNDGNRFGLYLAGGMHLFFNDWLALDLSVRDYIFSDNPTGLDADLDRAVTDADARFLNHIYLGVGLSIFLPTSAKRTP